MKRFFFDEEDDDNEDEMMNEAERMMPEFVPEFFAMPHQENPAMHILNCAVRMCEKSLYWRFLGSEKKTDMVKKVFNDLVDLIGGDDPEMDGKEKV